MLTEYIQVIPKIANFFGLGRILKIRPAGGDANVNFFVKTEKGRYFIKIVAEPYTKHNKAKETYYVSYLANRNLPVVRYIPTTDGEVVFQGDGIVAMVQRAISGCNPIPNLVTVKQVGHFLGTMHNLPFRSVPQRHGWLSPEVYINSLSQIATLKNQAAHQILDAYESCREFADNVLTKLPNSVIHGDLHYGNVLFRKNKLIAVVDWEDSMIGASLLDFVSSAAYWCFEEGRIRPRLYGALFESYISVTPFTDAEVRYLPDCLRYVGVIQTIWRFINSGHYKKDLLWGLRLKIPA